MSSEQNTQAEHATLTETYERLRHSTDEAELHEFARRTSTASSVDSLTSTFGNGIVCARNTRSSSGVC